MEMTNCSLSEPDKGILDAIELWYESKRSKRGNVNRNVMAVGIGISELLQKPFSAHRRLCAIGQGKPSTRPKWSMHQNSFSQTWGNACLRIRGRQNLTRYTPRWRLSLPQLSTLPYPVTLAKTLVLKLRMQSPISSSSESRSISLTGRESKSKSIFKNQFLSLSMIS